MPSRRADPTHGTRAHRGFPLRPPVTACYLGHCAPSRLTRSKAVGRCHAFHPHPLAGAPPCRHWPRYWPHVATPFRRTPVVPRPTLWLALSYGPPRAHYLGGYQDRLLGGPLGLPDLRCTAPDGVKHKDYRGEVLG
jgi:hypothetical protein